MNPLKALQDHGQAVWLDFLSRGFMAKGGLKKLVDEDGLRGLTSNPSIFENAIGHTGEYDEAIAGMLRANDRSAAEIFEELAVEDIKEATDILRPVFDAAHGTDGFVSIEVSPYLATDTRATIAEAKRLWSAIDRKNLMIKVPGTAEGLPAVRDLIADGINVNITLLFAQEVYEQVVEAYLSGLEAHASRGGDISRIASVASFFVSRIDTAVDKLLDDAIARANDPDEKARLNALKGKIAVANAKLAYQRYLRLFAGERWAALAAHGAKPQRLLWASTGTKNKAYSDVLYVEELIGPDTVNTMPVATLDAFRDHGKVRDSLGEDAAGAHRLLGEIARAGISLDSVTDRLVEDGVRLFADAADKLLGAVAKKRGEILDGKSTGRRWRSATVSPKKRTRSPKPGARTAISENSGSVKNRCGPMPTRTAGSAGWTASATTRSPATPPSPKRSNARASRMRFFSAWADRVSGRKCWPPRSAAKAARRGCGFSIPPCRRRSPRSRPSSISPKPCSSSRASRAHDRAERPDGLFLQARRGQSRRRESRPALHRHHRSGLGA
jgi:transaldolase